jgi:phosphatidylinositol alpha-1,6-mannosyltransferase
MSFPPQTGGVQTYLFEVFRRIGTAHELTVVTPVAVRHDNSNLRIVQPEPANLLGYWRALHGLRPDYIVSGHAHPQLLLAAALYRRAQFLTVAHGNDYLAAQVRWHRRLFNRMLARAQPLVTTTRYNAKRLKALGVEQVAIVLPGTDPERFRPGDWSKDRARTLLTVGRLIPRKGIDTVIRSLPELLQTFPDLVYWIAGEGPDRQRLEALVAERQLENTVRFLGRVSDADLPDLYRRAGIFVMPVREEADGTSVEGFGIVYLEAAASGLPVVAGDSGGAAEAVKGGETGMVVTPSPEAVTKALSHLLGDDAKCRQLGVAGRRWVEDNMNWDRAAQQLLEVLARHDG